MKQLKYKSGKFEVSKCGGCGRPIRSYRGSIHEKGKEVARCFVRLHDHDGRKVATLLMEFVGKGRKWLGTKKDMVLLAMWREGHGVGMSTRTFPDDPGDVIMTQEEALACPALPLIWEIANFVVDHDPYIRPYLEGGEEAGPVEGVVSAPESA